MKVFWRSSLLKQLSNGRRLVTDRCGGVLVTFSLAAPLAIALVGFGLEAGMLYRLKRAEQSAADAASLAGAIERAKSGTGSVTTAALNAAAANGFSNAGSTSVTVHAPPTSGAYAGNSGAVEVVITTSQPGIMPMSLIKAGASNGPTVLTSQSVAMVQAIGSACVLALDPAASSAVTNSGSATIGMQDCVVAANSNNVSAIAIGGSSALTAYSLWTSGGVDLGGASTITLTEKARTHMWGLADPYASLTIPTLGSCTYSSKKVNAGLSTLSPGVYCDGLDIGANAVVTLNPGTYYINRGDLKVNGQATVKCNCSGNSGVTFVFTSTTTADQIGKADINGGADVNLTAPRGAGDTFAGLLFVQDRNASTSGSFKLNGGSKQVLSGAIYVPRREVQFSGTTNTASNACIEIVARLITFIGNATVVNSGCAALGVKPVLITQSKLVQ